MTQLAEMQQIANELAAHGIPTSEVHNRAAVLWLHDLEITRSIAPKSMEGLDLKTIDYQAFKLVVGTILNGIIHGGLELNKSLPNLRWLQDHAIDKGYRVQFIGSPVQVRAASFIESMCSSHAITTGLEMRAGDMRVLIQYLNPVTWSRRKMEGFIIGNDKQIEEENEIVRLVGEPKIKVLSVYPKVFAEEFQRYIGEHFKVEFSISDKIVWQAGCIDTINNIARASYKNLRR